MHGRAMRIIEATNALLTGAGKKVTLIIGNGIGPPTKSMFSGIERSSVCVIKAQK
jgi:hypothetical protein